MSVSHGFTHLHHFHDIWSPFNVFLAKRLCFCSMLLRFVIVFLYHLVRYLKVRFPWLRNFVNVRSIHGILSRYSSVLYGCVFWLYSRSEWCQTGCYFHFDWNRRLLAWSACHHCNERLGCNLVKYTSSHKILKIYNNGFVQFGQPRA